MLSLQAEPAADTSTATTGVASSRGCGDYAPFSVWRGPATSFCGQMLPGAPVGVNSLLPVVAGACRPLPVVPP